MGFSAKTLSPMTDEKNWRHVLPYEQQFLFVVTPDFVGKPLLEFYTTKFKYKSADEWLTLIENDLVTINHQIATKDTLLQLGDAIRTKRIDVTEPAVNATIEILFDAQGLLILNKKAPIPVHPSGRYYKNSLTTVLREMFPEKTFHTIHRLDKWTTGVLILATDSTSARHLHLQVEKQRIQKNYGVIAVGNFAQNEFIINEAIGRIAGAHRGTGENATHVKPSTTEFQVQARHPTQSDLYFLKATPITGRTNQIRVHVQSAGGYVLHDPLYSPEKKADDARIPFLGLHCRAMRFVLPDNSPITIQAPWPNEFLQLFPQPAW